MTKILEQFKFEHQEIYQDNYRVKQYMHLENQYLSNFYVNQSKQGVFMQHNKVIIDEQTYRVSEEYLLINLKKNSPELEMLRLYEDGIDDLKLIKY